jgi:hypothetical protein
MAGKPVFEVRMPNGHAYKIFANGDTEGFAEDRNYAIVNGITALARQNYAQGMIDGATLCAAHMRDQRCAEHPTPIPNLTEG